MLEFLMMIRWPVVNQWARGNMVQSFGEPLAHWPRDMRKLESSTRQAYRLQVLVSLLIYNDGTTEKKKLKREKERNNREAYTEARPPVFSTRKTTRFETVSILTQTELKKKYDFGEITKKKFLKRFYIGAFWVQSKQREEYV